MARSTNLRRVLIFLVLVGATIWALIQFTFTPDTITVFKQLNFKDFLILGAMFLGSYILDSAILGILGYGVKEPMGWQVLCKVPLFRVLFNTITPFAFGGQPVMILTMTRYNIPPGRASSIIFTKFMLLNLVVFLITTFSVVLFWNQLPSTLLKIFFLVTGVGLIGMFTFIVIGLTKPQIVLSFLIWVGKVWGKFSKKHNSGKYKRKLVHELRQIRVTFAMYTNTLQGFISLITACLTTLLYQLLQVGSFWVILRILGAEISLVDGFSASILATFLFSFVPTPGATGFGEFFFIMLFNSMVFPHILGLALILWRFSIHYSFCIIGVPVAIHEFTPGRLKIRKQRTKENSL